MNNKMFSIVGCEHAHIEIFIQEMLEDGYTCKGIYEPWSTELATRISERFHIPLIDRDMAMADDVSIVGCSARNSEKINWIEKCEQLGKSIMIDKPAVTNEQDFKRLEAVVSRGKIEIGMLLTERFHPAVYTLKEQIDQGVLGDILSIGMRKPHRLNPAGRPDWFFSKEQCGGIIIDLLIHDYDLLRWFTGKEIVQSDGYMVKNGLKEHPEFYDVASIQVLMEGNVTAQLYADWHTPDKSWTWGDGRIFVTGTEGFAELRLSGDPFVGEGSLLLRTTDKEAAANIPLVQPPVSITQDFMNRVAGESGLLTSGDILLATRASLDADLGVKLVQG